MESRDARGREIQSSIRDVLNQFWDPLGTAALGANDEYDSLIGPIYQVLVRGGDKQEIIRLLEEFETKIGGLASDIPTLNEVTQKLTGLNVSFETKSYN